MAIFTDKIVTASFLDYPQNTLVEVIYKEGDQNTAYVMEVDFTQDDFKALLQELTLDEIESKTKASVDIEKKFFTDAVESEIERRWALESEKVKKAYDKVDEYTLEEKQKVTKELQSKFNGISDTAKITPKNVIDYFNNAYSDKDAVFNMKIAVLEDPIVATSKDKSLKMKIRKAKTLFEILEVYSALKV